MVDAAVDELRTAIEAQARRAVGSDLALTGQRARLGLKVQDSARGAVLSATGPWALVERPRRGGYVIRPKRKGGALRVGKSMWRATARGGPISAPLRPFEKGSDDGRAPALDAVAKALDKAVAGA